MENKRKIKIVSSGVIALAVLAMTLAAVPSALAQPPYPANSTYFMPEDSTGVYCQNDTIMQVRFNITNDVVRGVTTDISFDPNCVNITAANFTNCPLPDLQAFVHHGDWVRITAGKLTAPWTVTGDNLLANITLHCVNETSDCTSSLNFTNHQILNASNTPIPNVAHNGTVTCEAILPPYLVTYTISNRTITPPQTTSIDVGFSEKVSYKIAIEKNSATIYDWTGSAKNPDPKPWDGTYETNGTVVPAGDYTVNVTGTNTTTGLSVINNTEIITVATIAKPDLNVSSIDINHGDTRAGDIIRVNVNESNNISAVVWNNGNANAGAFDVCFDADGEKIGCEAVAGLAAGANTTVSIEWTPTCVNFSSVMPGFPYTSEAFWINVSADCNCTTGCCPNCPPDGSCGKINESDETDNTLSKFIPAIQTYKTYNVIGGVVNNGYKSKNFDCNTTEEPLTLFEYDDMYGGIAYNVSGEKIGNFAPGNTSTRVHHIDIPDGRTVKKARLYVYWYDKWGNYKTYPTGCLANLSVNFSGTEFMPEEKYNDAKGFGYYQSPKGTYAYNVTSKVAGSGDYIAVVKNIDSNNGTTLLGEMLYVVYEDPTGNNKIQLWTLEGNDYLMASHGSYQYSVSVAEATATVAFSGAIDLANVTSATLISVVAQGMAPGSNMLFNGSIIKTDAWDSPTEAYPGSKINIESINVKSNLLSSGNNMGFQDNGTNGIQASNAMLILKFGEPDLNVSSISVNPGNTRAEEIVRAYVNENNNISAVVWNNGTADAEAFDVCFDVDGVKIGCETVAGLAAGANTTVSIEWTPTCANFSSVMPGFPYTSEAFWINVTADCNCTIGCCPNCPPDGSCGKINESDETNNTLAKYVPAIQTYKTYNVIGGVVNNGYKSKNFDCDITEKPLTLFEYDDVIIGGGIVYNVSGEKIGNFQPTNTSTRIHHIDIPGNATVKKARLYVYWYDKWGNYKTYPSGCLANLSVTMDSTVFMPEEKYNDAKGFGYYQSPKGTYAYDVTSEVTGSGDYTAIVENIDPANSTTLLGQLLFVQYEDTTKTTRVQKWILEGNDYLMAADDTHNKYDYSVSPEEATATVAFPGSIDLTRVTNATLISVVAQGMENGSNMLFNGEVIKTDAWDSPTEAYPGSKINVESIDVKTNLLSSGNNMGFQDNGTNGMQASNAFLIVEYEKAPVPAPVPVLNPIGLIALIGILSVVLAVATATLRRREKR